MPSPARLRDYRTAIQILGGVTLLGAGIKLYLTRPTVTMDPQTEKATLWDYVWDIPQAFFLTITNPGAVLGLIGDLRRRQLVRGGRVARRRADHGGRHHGRQLLLLVRRITAHQPIRHRLDMVRLGQINRIAGLVLIAFGGVLIGEMVIKRLRFW